MPPIPRRENVPAAAPGERWKPGKVTFKLLDGSERTVRARVYGGLAVHPAMAYPGKWAVTVISVGQTAARLDSQEDAFRFGDELWKRACLALRGKTKQAVRDALPPWVIAWARSCQASGKYADPEPFVKQWEDAR
jgi:hypothetical protein